jgi:16S rRNA (cytosine967-C5)-methyltransferase
MQHDWPEVAARMLDENNVQPPMWLRVNRRRTTRDAMVATLHVAGFALNPQHCVGRSIGSNSDRRARAAGFQDGLVSVQDAAAQLAIVVLAPRPGERILDLCAAPGGKTMSRARTNRQQADVLAVDVSEPRLQTRARNLARLGSPQPSGRAMP